MSPIFIRLTDEHLIDCLHFSTKEQDMKMDDLCQVALQKCEQLGLLKDLNNSGPLDKSAIWGKNGEGH